MWKSSEEGTASGVMGSGVAEGVANMKDDLNVLASDAKATARAGMVEIKDAAGRVARAAKDKGAAGMDAAGRTLAAHPFKSVAIAFGVGVLFGALMCTREK